MIVHGEQGFRPEPGAHIFIPKWYTRQLGSSTTTPPNNFHQYSNSSTMTTNKLYEFHFTRLNVKNRQVFWAAPIQRYKSTDSQKIIWLSLQEESVWKRVFDGRFLTFFLFLGLWEKLCAATGAPYMRAVWTNYIKRWIQIDSFEKLNGWV